jgi:hypothetical protein
MPPARLMLTLINYLFVPSYRRHKKTRVYCADRIRTQRADWCLTRHFWRIALWTAMANVRQLALHLGQFEVGRILIFG